MNNEDIELRECISALEHIKDVSDEAVDFLDAVRKVCDPCGPVNVLMAEVDRRFQIINLGLYSLVEDFLKLAESSNLTDDEPEVQETKSNKLEE